MRKQPMRERAMEWLYDVWSAWTGDQHFWFTERVLRPFSTYLSLPTAVFAALGWYAVTIGRKRQHRRWFFETLAGGGDHKPAILIVDLTHGNIETHVLAFSQTVPAIKGIASDRIFRLARSKDLGPGDIPPLIDDLRDVINEMMLAGVIDLHLFYAGPLAYAVILGGELKNRFNVIVYQRSALTSAYESWGPMRHIIT
jgi:hypothetical protein